MQKISQADKKWWVVFQKKIMSLFFKQTQPNILIKQLVVLQRNQEN